MSKVIEGYYCEDTWSNDYEALCYGFISKKDYDKVPEEEKCRYDIFGPAYKKRGKWHRGACKKKK